MLRETHLLSPQSITIMEGTSVSPGIFPDHVNVDPIMTGQTLSNREHGSDYQEGSPHNPPVHTQGEPPSVAAECCGHEDMVQHDDGECGEGGVSYHLVTFHQTCCNQSVARTLSKHYRAQEYHQLPVTTARSEAIQSWLLGRPSLGEYSSSVLSVWVRNHLLQYQTLWQL